MSLSKTIVTLASLLARVDPVPHVLNSQICRSERAGGAVSPAAYVTFTQIQRPGFVSSPPSRVYLCKLGVNLSCGNVQYEPQSVEAHKGFPVNGPADGHIVGGERFPEVDEAGVGRWTQIKLGENLRALNATHVIMHIVWAYTTAHRTSAYHLFGTTASYNIERPLKREHLKHLHSVRIIRARVVVE